MPISQGEQLFRLIKSLTKSEKRSFKLYARRTQDSDSLKYIRLFELLERQTVLNESEIQEKLGGINKIKLSNLKRHLYTQILTTLKLTLNKSKIGIKVREYLDFAYILYGRGLYKQSLKILAKVKKMAANSHEDIQLLGILEFEKIIESRHITRSGISTSLQLVNESKTLSKHIYDSVQLSNLRLLLHSFYIKNGHVRNEAEKLQVQELFEEIEEIKPMESLRDFGFLESIYYYQAFVWYYYILQDFENCYVYAQKWISRYESSEEFISRDVNLYMRGYHYLLTSAFYLKDAATFHNDLASFEHYRKRNYARLNENSKILSFIYVHSARFNKYFLTGNFTEGLSIIPATLRRLKRYSNKLDWHRVMVFYYKISWMYFGAGQPDKSVDYLNKIINIKAENLREDIQGYSRIMFLMAHYELGNYDLMDYLISQVESYYKKMTEKDELQIITLSFFRKLGKVPIDERISLFLQIEEELQTLASDAFGKRALLYLDILSWVQSKTQNQNISVIIADKLSYSLSEN